MWPRAHRFSCPRMALQPRFELEEAGGGGAGGRVATAGRVTAAEDEMRAMAATGASVEAMLSSVVPPEYLSRVMEHVRRG